MTEPVPFAARVTDVTAHPPSPGSITGPGARNVQIEGLPAAVAGDGVACTLPPPAASHKSSFLAGSSHVRICGQAAIRVGDTAVCGAIVVSGASRVRIG